MNDIWGYNPDWQNESVSLTHGQYAGRLSVGAKPCLEICGYSMWHLLAAKCLSPEVQEEFLASAHDVETNELIDDIRETMAVFDQTWSKGWHQWSGMRGSNTDWNRIREITAWCTPLEICARLQVPLIAWTQDWMLTSLHPVIEAAQAESLRNLGR